MQSSQQQQQQQQQRRRVVSSSGRSVRDYDSETELREALSSVSLHESTGTAPSRHCNSNCIDDWLLPVPDSEAEEQTVDGELQRLLALKSYLLLDAEKEQAFDRLTEQARQEYAVPTSLISLVDLGRQFLFSNTGNPGDVRETPRSLAFCAHTILNKNGICVVNDTTKDERFRNSRLVTQAPHLRFYAGAPLISPEGYNLGTFCVEGPEPRPEGLSEREREKLKEYAAKAMQLMVERRQALRDRLSYNKAKVRLELQQHAAVATNLGVILYTDHADTVNAMRLFQESVQTLMYVEGEEGQEGNTGGEIPSKERQEIMRQLLNLLTAECGTPESRQALVRNVTLLYPNADETATITATGATTSTATSATTSTAHTETNETAQPGRKAYSPLDCIPALFNPVSKLKGTANNRNLLPFLAFCEPFKIDLNAPLRVPDGKERFGECPFVIPVNQCSKATLFNMGLIHYHLGSADTAVQFFDLAASLSAKMDPLAFDPVVLACLNNIAQIHLQYRRPNDAMEMLADALTRGNAALANMYADIDRRQRRGSCPEKEENRRTRRLRRKLARTVMNMGHVHFFNCEYDASMVTCVDALRLMHANMDDVEVAAVWYNLSVIHYHRDQKMEALEHINKFLELAYQLKGPNHVQIADALFMKGRILFEMGHLYDCMNPLNESLSIRRIKLGERNSAVAESLCLIGKVLQAREEYDFALNALKQALDVQRTLTAQESSGGTSSFDEAQILLEVGRAYHALGDLKESVKVYKEVAELTREFFGERHAFVAQIDSILGNLYLETGQVEESLAAFEEAMKIRIEQGLPEDMGLVQDHLAGTRIKLAQSVVAPIA